MVIVLIGGIALITVAALGVSLLLSKRSKEISDKLKK